MTFQKFEASDSADTGSLRTDPAAGEPRDISYPDPLPWTFRFYKEDGVKWITSQHELGFVGCGNSGSVLSRAGSPLRAPRAGVIPGSNRRSHLPLREIRGAGAATAKSDAQRRLLLSRLH
jgi:hypothetical protein